MSQGKIYKLQSIQLLEMCLFSHAIQQAFFTIFFILLFYEESFAVHYKLLPESIKHGAVKLQNKGQKLCRIECVQLIIPLRIRGN